MKFIRPSIACVLALALAASVSVSAKVSPYDSIRPLQHMDASGELTDVKVRPRHMLNTGEVAAGELHGSCTTWATRINHQVIWVTKMHCVVDEAGEPLVNFQFYIGDKPAKLHSGNAELDLATLIGPSAPGLQLSYAMPQAGDKVYSIGYPQGWEFFNRVEGFVANPTVRYGKKPQVFSRWQLPVAGGASGSPVLDKDGFVVGDVQHRLCHPIVTFCPMSGGQTLKQLRLFLYGE